MGEDLGFRTYLYIELMLEGGLKTNQYETKDIEVLNEIEYLEKQHQLQRISPYYHIIHEVDEMNCVDTKVKVRNIGERI
ncbi:DUF5085 family protein [Staphylococcus carnosus]|uniref:Uncharacterized protein n=2 Tax=Staphylococcus carnosus TaxID=1281 RepID=B9DLE9_STACT|nr:DUF5085 family protein [Staphylococcus carnosus]GEP78164.1 hypothetical protein SCA04_24780 [Staphylococcus carnosus]GEP80465.1 hypothetical protein SCA05_22580 [Staphylococcus carnosus]CAL27048.1 hypothetical protein SCA_0135 [Staphylococcus carnosus subsp. carnosus TM300]